MDLFGRKAEQLTLLNRIAELEERLCPAQQHDWKLVSSSVISDMQGTVKYSHWQCLRCGKKTITSKCYDED